MGAEFRPTTHQGNGFVGISESFSPHYGGKNTYDVSATILHYAALADEPTPPIGCPSTEGKIDWWQKQLVFNKIRSDVNDGKMHGFYDG